MNRRKWTAFEIFVAKFGSVAFLVFSWYSYGKTSVNIPGLLVAYTFAMVCERLDMLIKMLSRRAEDQCP
jgi:hypothetical protein